MYADESLTCTDCGTAFVFSAGEQEFFATKGFQNKPNRCPECRSARKAARASGGAPPASPGGGSARAMFSVTCSSCGRAAEVPFQPRGDKPVFCRDCFSRQRSYR
ncbi:MAG: zinc-ribbon domain containing protein [Vulcanimicrobiaceae bacterium]